MLAPSRRLDPDCISAALAGDPEAMDAVLDAWLPRVYRWCEHLGRPHRQVDTNRGTVSMRNLLLATTR